MGPHTESQTHHFKDAQPSLPWPHIPDSIYNPHYWGYDHTHTGETRGLEGGQDLKLNPGSPAPPQNERENTSYDVATLQDEEGELSEFPGETPPAFPLHPPAPTMSGAPGVTALTHRHGES